MIAIQCWICRKNMYRVYHIKNEYGNYSDVRDILYKCPACGDKIILKA